MAYDPLTNTTRKTRKVLLVSATGLLFATIFKVSVTNIPIVGVNVGIEAGLIKTVFLLLTTYNLLYFIVYIIDDIYYLKKPDVLSQDNTDIRNQLTNLDQYVLEAEVRREYREGTVYYSKEAAKKRDEVMSRLKEVRQETYDRIIERRKEFKLFTKFRLYVAEATIPIFVGLFAICAAIQPLLPVDLQSQIVADALSWIRGVSERISSGH